ncbi:MAG TPA: DNA methylase [Candidatus Scatomorpha intestinigallinarum]|uniref:DNA methylase n=1 Tax=Candidatus Scatomorpha intestinigallinarum TaxID=2840923 RepID=A0A9D1IZ77_9FIRM|nr:DNA methylase [Candidatus Scatomorpha intestinigallinarum]
MERTYIAIDLKSFYASVECRERGLDPLDTNLVVADESRTDKTICLAVTPSLKSYGIGGRCRLFEVKQRVREANAGRRHDAPGHRLEGKSHFFSELQANPSLAVDFLIAPPRMAYYMEYSTRIYQVYMKYVAPEDIIVYSIDEVFMDVTRYLKTYGLTPHDLAMKIILDVLKTTGITATAGIGTNLYLCKVAMDIVAKHIPADENGVRIAELDERSYRRELWSHTPLTDFWRVGRGYAKKLEEHGMFTMGDVARRSLTDEELFFKLFGKNAELLIDHAWGCEPCTIEAVKAYKPSTNSLGSGQVLHEPYTAEKARIVLREMADALSMELFAKKLVTDQLVVTIGYDVENIKDAKRRASYKGEIVRDGYGRLKPKHSHGTINLARYTSSTRLIMDAAAGLYDRVVDRNLLIRRLNITACRVIPESEAPKEDAPEQMDMFTDYAALDAERERENAALERERRKQAALLKIKRKYGKNAVLRGMNYEDGATMRDRNGQIGGHKA